MPLQLASLVAELRSLTTQAVEISADKYGKGHNYEKVSNKDSVEDDDSEAVFEVAASDMSEVEEDLRLSMDCLMELLPTMEQTLTHIKTIQERRRSWSSEHFSVPDQAQIFVQNVYENSKKADFKLVQRLGVAHWERLCATPFARGCSNSVSEESARSIAQQELSSQGSGLQSSASTSSKHSQPLASRPPVMLNLADSETRSLRVPPTPSCVGSGLPFKCDICNRTQDNIKSRIDWK